MKLIVYLFALVLSTIDNPAHASQKPDYPGDRLLKLAGERSLTPGQVEKRILDVIPRLFDHLKIPEDRRPIIDFKNLKTVVIDGDSDALLPLRNSLIIVRGKAELISAVNSIVISSGNLEVGSAENSILVSGDNLRVPFAKSRGKKGAGGWNLFIAHGWVEISHADFTSVYSAHDSRIGHTWKVDQYSPFKKSSEEVEQEMHLVEPLFSLDLRAEKESNRQKEKDEFAAYSSNPEDFLVEGSELHVLSVSRGQFRKIEVDVSVVGTPLTLLLSASDEVTWDIQLRPNVQLQSVFLLSHFPQRVRGLSDQVRVIRGVTPILEGLGPGRNGYLEALDRIEARTGKKPRTLQMEMKDSSKVIIDGVRTVSPPESSVGSRFGRARGGLVVEGGRPGSLVSIEPPVFTHCCSGAYSQAFVAKELNAGRHYLEAQVRTRKEADHADRYTNIDLVLLDQYYTSPFGAERDRGRKYGVFDYAKNEFFTDGDVVGLAVDMDSGQYHFHINGDWRTGPPGSPDGIKLTKLNRDYAVTATVTTSEDVPRELYENFQSTPADPATREAWLEHHDQWIFNLGAQPFKYPLPKGFAPIFSNEGRSSHTN